MSTGGPSAARRRRRLRRLDPRRAFLAREHGSIRRSGPHAGRMQRRRRRRGRRLGFGFGLGLGVSTRRPRDARPIRLVLRRLRRERRVLRRAREPLAPRRVRLRPPTLSEERDADFMRGVAVRGIRGDRHASRAFGVLVPRLLLRLVRQSDQVAGREAGRGGGVRGADTFPVTFPGTPIAFERASLAHAAEPVPRRELVRSRLRRPRDGDVRHRQFLPRGDVSQRHQRHA